MSDVAQSPAVTFARRDVEFDSGGVRCAAWLYVPEGAGPHPALVMAHGLNGVREMRLDAFAERFAAAGYACLVFDYRHFGASAGEPRQILDVPSQLADWRAAIAHARSRAEIDPDRVVAWGTSFSGGHVIEIAAEDDRLVAAVSQCPFTDGLASLRVIDPRTTLKLAAPALRDLARAARGREPVLVPAAGPPGSAAMMTAPDAEPGVLSLEPEGARIERRVAARLALKVGLYRPGRRAKDVSCPILFCVCEPDSVAPAKATLRHASHAPRGEVRTYPDGHFDIYNGEPFERIVADELEFLGRIVPVA